MDKVRAVLKSRKFWVLAASLIAIAQSFVQDNIDDFQALQLITASLAAYSLGTGIESGLERNK
jgi:hypothetical protein|tara:strand:- start:752 stop:940 length:189 start_codon:yes stop_codon:yes gene_type:complete